MMRFAQAMRLRDAAEWRRAECILDGMYYKVHLDSRHWTILHALRMDLGADLKSLPCGSMKAGNRCTQHSDQITLGNWLLQERCNYS